MRAAETTANPATAAAAAPAASPSPSPSSSLYPPPPLPATYRLCIAEATAPSFREAVSVVEAPLPRPGPGEVLIHVHWAGVNGGCETFRVRGEHAFAGNRARGRFLLGAEGSGVVAAVGEGVASLQVGQPVAFNGGAAFAEYTVAKAASCTPVAAPTAAATALTLSALTACAALEGTAGIRDSSANNDSGGAQKTVLVTAAAGGTGHFAVQLARLAGCRVVAVTGSKGKVDKLRELGPDAVVCAAAGEVRFFVLLLCVLFVCLLLVSSHNQPRRPHN
jgi:NADPH:quinone reductase-like Zn-dependent oxidoreductase